MDPKLKILVHFLQFGCIWNSLLRYNIQFKTGQTGKKCLCHDLASEFFTMNAPDSPHWTLNWHFGAFRTVWVQSRPFGCLTKLGAKRAELVQKFVPRSRVGIFHNERFRSTPLDPKLTFCYVSYYLDAFGTVRVPYKTWCKMGGTSAKVRATKSHRNYSHRTQPIHPIGP